MKNNTTMNGCVEGIQELLKRRNQGITSDDHVVKTATTSNLVCD